MNSLSWGLYLTELFASVGVGCAMISTFAGLMLIFCFIAYVANVEDSRTMQEIALKIAKPSMVVFFLCLTISVVVPGRETMRMILVSEFGERLYNSKDAQEIIDPAKELLKQYIQEQLAQRKKQ